MAIQIKIYSSLHPGLLNKWQGLWNLSLDANLYNSPQWLQATQKIYKYRALKIFAVYRRQELIAILPLVRTRFFGTGIWSSPGVKSLDKQCLLQHVSDPDVLNTLLHSAAAALPDLYLPEFDSAAVSLPAGYSYCYPVSVSPYLPLGTDPLRFMCHKRHKELIKFKTHAAPHLSFRHQPLTRLSQLEAAFAIDDHSCKGRRISSTFSSPSARRLISDLVKRLPRNFRIDLLLYDRQPIAYFIGFIHQAIYFAYDTSYLQEFSALRPGKIILCYLLPYLQKEGHNQLDFLRGNSQFKREFTPLSTTHYSIIFTTSYFKYLWFRFCLLVRSRLAAAPFISLYRTLPLAKRTLIRYNIL